MIKTKSTHTIAIDGPDGTGKTTQIELLEEKLSKHGLKVYKTKISGGTPLAMELRKVAHADYEREGEVDLYIHFAMYSSLMYDLGKKRSSYDIILIDRSPLCLIAYDGVAAGLEDLAEACLGCKKYFKEMDISTVFYLDAHQDILNERMSKRDKLRDYYEKQGRKYQDKIRKGYEIAVKYMVKQKNSDLTIVKLNADRQVEALNKEILNQVKIKYDLNMI